MKQLKHKMLVTTLAAALTLGGSFTGIVHSAFADDAMTATTPPDPAPSTPSASNAAPGSASNDTIGGLPIPVFAKLHGVDLRLGKAALSTALILGEDLQDVYDGLSQGSPLSQIGGQGGAGYQSQLIKMTQDNIDAAVAQGNLTSQQGLQLSNYASGVLYSETNDANYRDSDNSSTDAIVSKLLTVQQDSADIAQLLAMSQDDLTAELQAGKSLGAIAQEKGVSDDTLAAKLQSGLAADLKPIIWGSGATASTSAAAGASTSTDTSPAAAASASTQ